MKAQGFSPKATKTVQATTVGVSLWFLVITSVLTSGLVLGMFSAFVGFQTLQFSEPIGCAYAVGGPCYSGWYQSQAQEQGLLFYGGACTDFDFCQAGFGVAANIPGQFVDTYACAKKAYSNDCSDDCVLTSSVQATESRPDGALCYNYSGGGTCQDGRCEPRDGDDGGLGTCPTPSQLPWCQSFSPDEEQARAIFEALLNVWVMSCPYQMTTKPGDGVVEICLIRL